MSDTKIRLKDIAEKVGTSSISVHRAIHGKPGVSDELRARILEEVQKQNYSVNEIAATLRRSEYVIVILLPKPVNEDRFFFKSIWDSLRKKFPEYEKQKIRIRVIEHEYGLPGMAKVLEKLYDEPGTIHGLITVCDDEASVEWLRRFIRRGTKVVIVSNSMIINSDWISIMADHNVIGELSSAFLSTVLRKKAGKLLLLGGDEDIHSNYSYVDGFKKNMSVFYPDCSLEIIEGFSVQEIEKDIIARLKNGEYIGAVACNARTTYVLCKAVKQAECSGKMPVLGMDIFEEIAPYFEDGTLTASIYQSAREQGQLALEVLYRELTEVEHINTNNSSHIEMPCCLVMKQNYKYYL